MPPIRWLLTFLVAGIVCVLQAEADSEYRIGVGRADCTGPPVEVGFMGYAYLGQRGEGIHLRQYSRAFIIEKYGKRVVFVSVDTAMIAHSIKREVVSRLQAEYGDVYSADNIILSGTHTHGVPGGFMMYLLYDMTTFGFVPQTHSATIDGIVRSIRLAHENMQKGRIYIDETEILDASINRSPLSYMQNPPKERALYKYNTDKKLTQLRFVDTSNSVIGAINWFAVHPTSMNRSNLLVTSDNVGYASIMLESAMNPGYLPGRGKFVGAFASTNLGDLSPNIMGAKCEFTGESCDQLTSSCPPNHGMCIASGPGDNHFESTKIIANRLFDGAMRTLKNKGGRELRGPVNFVHQFIDIPSTKATYINPFTNKAEQVKGCFPAMGHSFAAGTTDGPGAFNFTQGTISGNPLWDRVRDFIATPTREDIECQKPKPILLATGRATFPYQWTPKIVPTQILQIGDVILLAVPGEFTTMSGRRLRRAVEQTVLKATGKSTVTIVAGLSNMYASYVSTPEEYQIQRYEGASTMYGPHTLTIYIEQFERMAQAMLNNEHLNPGPNPPFLDDKVISLQRNVLMDTSPSGYGFGSVVRQPESVYRRGDKVQVDFISGNPRNDLQHEKTYFTVERLNRNGQWDVVAADSDWCTWFVWKQTSALLGQSIMQVFWEIEHDVPPATYRIQHFGTSRRISGQLNSYVGTSKSFVVKD